MTQQHETHASATPPTRELRNTCPLDGRPLEPLRMTTQAELVAQVEKARLAQETWARLSVDARADALKKAAKELLRTRAEVIALAKDEMGKLEPEGLFNEALGPLDSIGGWAKVVRDGVARRDVRLNPLAFPKKKAHVDLVPRGVIGVIAPWNFPVAGLYRSVYPTLLTGNGLVLKPSEFTPRTSAWFVQKLAPFLPDGLVQIVQGDGQVGGWLVESGVDAIVFTGSVKTGRAVRLKCAELGLPSSIEMGGKDAAIVLADCDLPRTAAGLTQWALSNVGQACGALEIAYVDARIADALVARLGRAWDRLRVGPGPRGEVDLSPLANPRQLAIVEAHVADALAKGAKLVTGGKRVGTAGLWYAPTLLDHCTDAMDVVREETFGPVLAIVRVDGAAEAVRRINRSRYGLGASIWTEDTARAERLAEQLEVGVVDVNNHALTGAMPQLPWSGTRDTGFGVANSEFSLHTFVRPRAVLVDGSKDPELFWMPFDATMLELGELLADAQIGRILGAWKLPFLMRERVQRLKKFWEME